MLPRYNPKKYVLFLIPVICLSANLRAQLPPTGNVPKEILAMSKNCPSVTLQPRPIETSLSSGGPNRLVYDNTSIACLKKFTYATEEQFQQALIQLSSDPEYQYVGPNRYMNGHAETNDTYYKGNAAMNRAYDDLWNLKISNVDQAWDLSTGENVTVAIIDSGVDFTHQDAPSMFANEGEIPGNNIDDDRNGFVDDTNGWDFLRNENASSIDESGHGTHVAGIIAAKGNNALGIVGVAYNAKILPLRVLDKDSKGTEENVAKAIVYAAKMGAKVINISLGGTGESAIIHRALKDAKDLGSVIVDSSGNDHADANNVFPARYAETITVASVVNDGKTISYFSNHGEVVDLVAGGGGEVHSPPASPKNINILSLLSSHAFHNVVSEFLVENTSTRYVLKSGTSMAAPVVSGVAALVISANPSLTPDQVKSVLTSSAQPIDGGKNATYGYGLVDAYSATNMAKTGEFAQNPGGGCSIEIGEYSSMLGFFSLLMVTLVVLLKKDFPERKVRNHDDHDIGSTLL